MSDVKREWFDVDYYKVLGVSNSASAKDITTAYRKLARQYHPDANPGDAAAEERFKEISAAYDVVGDEKRRKEYDQVRRMGPMGGMFGGGGGRPGGQADFDFEGMGDLGDLLGSVLGGQGGGLFGGRGGRPMAQNGPNLEAKLDIEFAEAVEGLTTTLHVGRDRRAVKIKIPAGIESGQRVRLRGKGGAGVNGGQNGDLLVMINVRSHNRFGRSGKHLTLDAPLTFAEAALGTMLKVPTFDGSTVTLRVPAGTQSGQTFRVKDRGIATAKGTGDLLVTVAVHVPEDMSVEQIEALDAFVALSTDNPRAHWGQANRDS